jgi:hypothetical protein
MHHSLTHLGLAELNAFDTPPCLSLYLRTHRHHPDNQQDLLQFRQGIDSLTSSLKKRCNAQETQTLMDPFYELARDVHFWNHTLDGLAVLGGSGLFRVFVLPRPVAALTVVADSFHTKPLRRFLQSVGRYQVLGLSRQQIRLFEGDRDSISEITPPAGVPRTIQDALGQEYSEPHLTVSSYGGIGSASSPMRHGQGGKKDEIDKDVERFFRAVDRAVIDHCSKASSLPLILAALPEHHHLFHEVSHNTALLALGVEANPDALPLDELRQRAWQALKPQYQAQEAQWIDDFGAARGKGLGSAELKEVAHAAATGRVGTLLIEAERQMAGQLDQENGDIVISNLTNPHIDDLLDDLAELVQSKGGQVYVLTAERMPCSSGLAAIFRH